MSRNTRPVVEVWGPFRGLDIDSEAAADILHRYFGGERSANGDHYDLYFGDCHQIACRFAGIDLDRDTSAVLELLPGLNPSEVRQFLHQLKENVAHWHLFVESWRGASGQHLFQLIR